MKINKSQMELLQQLLVAAQNQNESDTDSESKSEMTYKDWVHWFGTYRQVCPEMTYEEHSLKESSEDCVFDFLYEVAHNKELLLTFLTCAYFHLSKRDVEKVFRQAEKEFWEIAEEDQMHFHLTGEHHEDCCCPKCDAAEPEPEGVCDKCREDNMTSESLWRMMEDLPGPMDKAVWDAAYAKFCDRRGITSKAA